MCCFALCQKLKSWLEILRCNLVLNRSTLTEGWTTKHLTDSRLVQDIFSTAAFQKLVCFLIYKIKSLKVWKTVFYSSHSLSHSLSHSHTFGETLVTTLKCRHQIPYNHLRIQTGYLLGWWKIVLVVFKCIGHLEFNFSFFGMFWSQCASNKWWNLLHQLYLCEE